MAEQQRPFATFALFAYNQERFIEEAVMGALAQDYSPLEIILSDDCSADGTFEIITRLASAYTGPHNVILNRNQRNLGLAMHVNRLFEMSSAGHLLLAAGDDISLPSRTAHAMRYFSAHPELLMLSLSTISFGEDGTSKHDNGRGEIERISIDSYLSGESRHPPGASRAIRRDVYDLFGPLSESCPTEDTTLLMRALLLGNVFYLPEVGVRYRRHAGGISQFHNIRKIKIESIRHQYLLDLDAAESKQLLTTARCAALRSAVLRFVRRRQLIAGMSNGRPLRYTLPPLLLAPELSFREKAKTLAKFCQAALMKGFSRVSKPRESLDE